MLAEGVTLLLAGAILGFAPGHGATLAPGLWLVAIFLAIGAFMRLVPAAQARFSDPASLLAKRWAFHPWGTPH